MLNVGNSNTVLKVHFFQPIFIHADYLQLQKSKYLFSKFKNAAIYIYMFVYIAFNVLNLGTLLFLIQHLLCELLKRDLQFVVLNIYKLQKYYFNFYIFV